jgi:hypothetical protein
MPVKEKMPESQFRRIINTLCHRWHIPEYADYMSERYWSAFSGLDEAGQRAFWQVLGVQEESLERRTMAQITSIILYQENNYLHYTMVRTKSGGDSTVRPEFVIRGRLFHPTRLKGSRLDAYIEPSCMKWALFPARHRADPW